MTSHHYTETATPDATKRYPSDLNDREFDLVVPHVAQKAGSDKKRIVDICEVWEHINPTGDYIWQQNKLLEQSKFRPIRLLDEA